MYMHSLDPLIVEPFQLQARVGTRQVEPGATKWSPRPLKVAPLEPCDHSKFDALMIDGQTQVGKVDGKRNLGPLQVPGGLHPPNNVSTLYTHTMCTYSYQRCCPREGQRFKPETIRSSRRFAPSKQCKYITHSYYVSIW